jgi:glucose-1-phosphate adenylyltransferase
MKDVTIISYSRSRHDSLLSLAESRSRYMMPFGGRFRVVDFTIQNAAFSGAGSTVIFNDFEDDLEKYVSRYSSMENSIFPSLKVVSRESADIGFCLHLVTENNTPYYIIYNGDNPSIIDFSKILLKFKNSKSKASLFKLKLAGTASMANTVLVTGRKYLLSVIKSAKKNKENSPNIFEMIINIMINKGIKNESIDAYYWSMKSVPDYYYTNMEILKNKSVSSIIFHKSPIRSYITNKGQAIFGTNAKAANSIISDNCKIYGVVMNSIIFPGVEIGENSHINDSIILPNVIIGSNSYITKTIIDERTDTIKSDNSEITTPYLSIGNKCRVGTNDSQIKNSEFPSLNDSITLIGKNCRIPDDARIGSACYVASGKGDFYFQRSKHLYNGLSVLN